MAGVRLGGVTKRYGAVTAVADLRLDVEDGEFLILLGPSGCGKSTVLRLIAGLEEPTVGEVYIGDRLVNDVEPKDRDIAMVFQSYALYPHMTVHDNMAFGLQLRGTPKAVIAERIGAAAGMLGIEELLKRKPAELSGGQRQRVALGRAIVREPQVFLMDEPLSNLDAKLRLQTRAELVRLHRRLGTTVVYVTHDQVEAMTMGDRIAVLHQGVLQQVASAVDLYNEPANLFVAGFVGSPPMNFFPAELSATGDEVFAEALPLRVRFARQQAKALGRATGRAVVVGVRPEDIVFGFPPARLNGHPHAPATVDVVEHLGAEQLIYLLIDGKSLVARTTAAAPARPGDTATIALRSEKLHVFDAVTQEALI